MSIIALIFILVVITVGFILVNRYVTEPVTKMVANIVLVIILLVFILSIAGIGGGVLHTRV